MTTDHGFLLGEHDWWGKNRMPFYNEISQIPLMIWHPDFASCSGQHRQALTQSIDLMPTFLDMFDVEVPNEVRGQSLLPLLACETKIRDAAIYGVFGGSVNVTDGRYTYFLYPEDLHAQSIYEYTLIPLHVKSFFTVEEFEGATLREPFDFTKGYPILRLPGRKEAKRPPMQGGGFADTETALYDTATDPRQVVQIEDEAVVQRLRELMLSQMRAHDAPIEAYRPAESTIGP